MNSTEIVLVMLCAVVASGFLMRLLPFNLPLPLTQIALGACIAEFVSHRVVLQPEIFFLLLLPPLLFLDGWRIPKDGLLRDGATIIGLALGLVVFTVAGAGFLIHVLIPAIPLPVAFALAAILSPTDPVAVSSIAARVPIPKRLMHVLEGEALLNDASGLVCFRFAVAAATTGAFSAAHASLTFLWVAMAGLGIGVGFVAAVMFVQGILTSRVGEEPGSPILISLLIPFGAYLCAEAAHASGILAAVGGGMAMSYAELGGRALARTRLQRSAVWSTVQFALNGIMFVLLGEQLPELLHGAVTTVEISGHENRWWLAVYAIVITAGLAALRLVWVWLWLRLTLRSARQQGRDVTPPPFRLIVVASLAGVRGAITLAGILTLPLVMPDGSDFPARDLVIFLSAAVILLSLILAAISLPALLVNLKLPIEPTTFREEDGARREAAAAAIQAIDGAQRELGSQGLDAETLVDAAARVIAVYQRRIDGAVFDDSSAEQVQRAELAERALRIAGIQAERETIFALARGRRLSDEVSRRLIRELDLMETRQQ